MREPITNTMPKDAAEPAGPTAPSSSAPDESALPFALTVQETSQVLRLDPRTVRAMLHTGELEGNQRGHAIRISRASVLDWLRGKRPSRARRGSR